MTAPTPPSASTRAGATATASTPTATDPGAGRVIDGPPPRRVGRVLGRCNRSTIGCEWHNSVLVDDAGALASILSLALDVTERQESAEALARIEERLRTALRAADVPRRLSGTRGAAPTEPAQSDSTDRTITG